MFPKRLASGCWLSLIDVRMISEQEGRRLFLSPSSSLPVVAAREIFCALQCLVGLRSYHLDPLA
jgi:hypothetical protein